MMTILMIPVLTVCASFVSSSWSTSYIRISKAMVSRAFVLAIIGIMHRRCTLRVSTL